MWVVSNAHDRLLLAADVSVGQPRWKYLARQVKEGEWRQQAVSSWMIDSSGCWLVDSWLCVVRLLAGCSVAVGQPAIVVLGTGCSTAQGQLQGSEGCAGGVVSANRPERMAQELSGPAALGSRSAEETQR
jgi:hypothetical protein